jgi:DNA-binding transcriptional LysR family regulator
MNYAYSRTQPSQGKHGKPFNASYNIDKDFDKLKSPHVSLKQWRTFHAVVACGSYAAAAEFLHISQPAVSYTVAQLEEQLGIQLLKLKGRKAEITEAGKILYAESLELLYKANELEKYSESLKSLGLAEIKLAVHVNFPAKILLATLRSFGQAEPHVRVRLVGYRETNIQDLLENSECDIAISTTVPKNYSHWLLCRSKYIPIAHKNNALFNLQRKLTAKDLENELEIRIHSGSIESKSESSYEKKNTDVWEVNDFNTAEKILNEGIGYGWFAEHQIENFSTKKFLKELPIEDTLGRYEDMYLVHRSRLHNDRMIVNLRNIFHQAALNKIDCL